MIQAITTNCKCLHHNLWWFISYDWWRYGGVHKIRHFAYEKDFCMFRNHKYKTNSSHSISKKFRYHENKKFFEPTSSPHNLGVIRPGIMRIKHFRAIRFRSKGLPTILLIENSMSGSIKVQNVCLAHKNLFHKQNVLFYWHPRISFEVTSCPWDPDFNSVQNRFQTTFHRFILAHVRDPRGISVLWQNLTVTFSAFKLCLIRNQFCVWSLQITEINATLSKIKDTSAIKWGGRDNFKSVWLFQRLKHCCFVV